MGEIACSISMSQRQSRRRTFLGMVGGFGATVLAGCGSSQSDGDGGDGGDGVGGSSSRYGGHIRTRSPASIASLNPMMNTSGAGYVATSWLYSKLTRTDDELNIWGDLAESWESNSDGSQWTFTLRENARFNHNGEPVRAEDVKATLETMHDPDTGSPGSETIPTLESIEAVDDTTVEINLSEPDADIDAKLANRWSGILPREVAEDPEQFEAATNQSYGSGAWNVEEFSRDSGLVVSRSDSWHITSDDGDQLPYADRLTLRIIPEDSSFVNAVRQQEIDVQGKDITPSIYDELTGISGVTGYEKPSGRVYPIFMNPSQGQFADRRIRHAIKYAVDKEAILQVAGRGLGVIGQDNFVSPVHRFYAELPDEFGTGAEIEQAQATLEDAGYSDGIEIETPLITSPEMAREKGQTAVIVQENCEQAGIDIEIQEVSSDFWLSNVEGKGDFYVGIYGLRVVEDSILRQVLHSDGPWNYGWSNTEFDAAIDEARSTTNIDRRRELYERAQRIAQLDAGMLAPYFAASIGIAHDYVQNYKQDPTTLQVPLHDAYLSDDSPTK